ncbi:hypothetical protein [Streptomyces sp. NPDC006527]|uniref:hypothetical protein n=1 Tax=Streptomyces sp. NPDC006527 TaxID=3364749 RepID=UPI0036BFD671
MPEHLSIRRLAAGAAALALVCAAWPAGRARVLRRGGPHGTGARVPAADGLGSGAGVPCRGVGARPLGARLRFRGALRTVRDAFRPARDAFRPARGALGNFHGVFREAFRPLNGALAAVPRQRQVGPHREAVELTPEERAAFAGLVRRLGGSH